jgi:hypothetical protein
MKSKLPNPNRSTTITTPFLNRTHRSRASALPPILVPLVLSCFFFSATIQAAPKPKPTPTPTPTPAPTPSTVPTLYQYTSQPGDYIGGGGSNSYTPANATFTASASAEEVVVFVSTATEFWGIDLAVPAGEQLHPGTYYYAERASFRTGRSPGVDVFGDGRGCNEVWGSFALNQIQIDASGNVTLLDATFVQQCESDTAPLLQGIMKYQAPPLSYSFVSDPGDYIGQGVTKSYEGATSLFFLSGTDTNLNYAVSGQRDSWNVTIAPPTGQQLRVHSYKTQRFVDKTHAGLDVSGDGRGCNTSVGTLNIDAITFDAAGNVTGLSATFDQQCEGGTPALHGTIHYYQ